MSGFYPENMRLSCRERGKNAVRGTIKPLEFMLRPTFVALFETQYDTSCLPHATRVSDPRAVRLTQVKAKDLVVAFGHLNTAMQQIPSDRNTFGLLDTVVW